MRGVFEQCAGGALCLSEAIVLRQSLLASRSITNAGKEPIRCLDGTAKALSFRILREIALRARLILVTDNIEGRIKQQRV